MTLRPFHLAFPVTNLVITRHFYENILGCSVGRTSDKWIDFNLFGHQITAHLCTMQSGEIPVNLVDGKKVPVQHWGVILEMEQWETLAKNISIFLVFSISMRGKNKVSLIFWRTSRLI